MSLKERIAAIQQREDRDRDRATSPTPPNGGPTAAANSTTNANGVTLPASASAGALRAKIASFESKGGVPVPRGSFGLPEPAPAPKQRLGLYGNRIPSSSAVSSSSRAASSKPNSNPAFLTSAALLGLARPSEPFSIHEPRALALPHASVDEDRELEDGPLSPASPRTRASPPAAPYPGMVVPQTTGGSTESARARSPDPHSNPNGGGSSAAKDAARVVSARGTAFSTALDIARTAEAHVKAERRKSALWHASAAGGLVPQHTGGSGLGLTPQHTGGLTPQHTGGLVPQYTGGPLPLAAQYTGGGALTPQHTGALSLSLLPVQAQYTGGSASSIPPLSPAPYSPSLRAFSASGEPIARPRERVLSFERGERRMSGHGHGFFVAPSPVLRVEAEQGEDGGEEGEMAMAMTEEPGEMEMDLQEEREAIPLAAPTPHAHEFAPTPAGPRSPTAPEPADPPRSPPPRSPEHRHEGERAQEHDSAQDHEDEPRTPSSTHSHLDLDAHLHARAAGLASPLSASFDGDPSTPDSTSSFGGGAGPMSPVFRASFDSFDAPYDGARLGDGEQEEGEEEEEDLQPLPNTLHTHAFRAHLSTITERTSYSYLDNGGSERGGSEPPSAGWESRRFSGASSVGSVSKGGVHGEGEDASGEGEGEGAGDGYAPELTTEEEGAGGGAMAGVGARARALFGNAPRANGNGSANVHANANANANANASAPEGAVIYTNTAAGSPYRLSGLTERGYTPSLRSEGGSERGSVFRDGDGEETEEGCVPGKGAEEEEEEDGTAEVPETPLDPRTPTAPPAPDPRFLAVRNHNGGDEEGEGDGSRSRPDSLLELYGGRSDGEEEEYDEEELREEERRDALALAQAQAHGQRDSLPVEARDGVPRDSLLDSLSVSGGLHSQRDSLLSLATANSARNSLAPSTPPRSSGFYGANNAHSPAPSTPQRDSQILTMRPLSTASLGDTGSPSHVALAHRVPVPVALGAAIGGERALRGVERGRAMFVPGASPLGGERRLSPSPSPGAGAGAEEQERGQVQQGGRRLPVPPSPPQAQGQPAQAPAPSQSPEVPAPEQHTPPQPQTQSRPTPRPGARAHTAARPNTSYASSSQDDAPKAPPRRHAYTTGAPRPHTAYVPPPEDDEDDVYAGVGEFGTISFGGATQSFSAVVHGRVREGSAPVGGSLGRYAGSGGDARGWEGRSNGAGAGAGGHSRSGSDKRLPPMPTSPGYASGELAQLLAEAADLEIRLERGELPGEALRRLSMRPPPRSGGVSTADAPPVPALPAGVQSQAQGQGQGASLKPQRSFRNPLGRSRSERRTKVKEEGRPVASASVGNLLEMQGEIQSGSGHTGDASPSYTEMGGEMSSSAGAEKSGHARADKSTYGAGDKSGYYVANPTPLSPPPRYSFAHSGSHPHSHSHFGGDQLMPVPPSPAPTDDIPPTPPPKSPGFGGGTRYFSSLRRLASTSRSLAPGATSPGARGSVATSLVTSTSSELSSEDSMGLATPPDDASSVHTAGGSVAWPSLGSKKSVGSLGRGAVSLAGKMWNRSRSKSSSTVGSIEAPSPPPPLPVPTLPSPPILKLDPTPFVIPPIQTTGDPDSPTSSTPIANPSHSLSQSDTSTAPTLPLVKAKSYNAPRPPNLVLTNSNGSSSPPSLLPVPNTAPETRPASWMSVSSGSSSMAPSPLFDKAIFDAFPSVPPMPTPQSGSSYTRSSGSSVPPPQSTIPSGYPSGGGRPLPVPGGNSKPIIDPSAFMDPGPSFVSKSASTMTDRSFVQSVHPGTFAREQPLLARLAETQMRVNPLP